MSADATSRLTMIDLIAIVRLIIPVPSSSRDDDDDCRLWFPLSSGYPFVRRLRKEGLIFLVLCYFCRSDGMG